MNASKTAKLMIVALLEFTCFTPLDMPCNYSCLIEVAGLTPLGMACLQNSTEIAELLIKAGAKPNIGDKRNNLPLHYAARNGNLHLVQLLHEHGK